MNTCAEKLANVLSRNTGSLPRFSPYEIFFSVFFNSFGSCLLKGY